MKTTHPPIFSLPQAAERLGVSRDAIRRMVRSGLRPVRRVGRMSLVAEADLDALRAAGIIRPKGRPVESPPVRVYECRCCPYVGDCCNADGEGAPDGDCPRRGRAERAWVIWPAT